MAGFPLCEFGFAPTAVFANPLNSCGQGSVDKHNRIAHAVPTCFEQDGGVEYDGLCLNRRLRFLDCSSKNLPNRRMGNLFQFGSRLSMFGRCAEHFFRKLFPIHLAAGVEHVLTELPANALLRFRLPEDLMTDPVSIDDGDVSFRGNPGRHRTLSGSDSSNQPNDWYVVTLRHVGSE